MMPTYFLNSHVRRYLCLAIAFVLLLAAAACGQEASDAAQKRYNLVGKVVSIDKRGKMVTVAHQEIPGLMAAMTMPFMLKTEWALDVLNPGDQISAALIVEGSRTWLEEPVVTRQENTASAPPAAAAAAATTSSPLTTIRSAGDQLPSFKLVNQDGVAIDTQRYAGRALLLTFIYTRCPLPDYCILMNDNFAEINQRLSERPGLEAKTQLLSISIDPEHDTPQVMREHGLKLLKNNSKKFERWEFATGTAREVRAVAEYFGLHYEGQNDQIIHSLRTAIIAPDGKIFKIYHGNEWTAPEALRDLEAALSLHRESLLAA
ncbi:MAG: SCO family protein [Pyrinomonadaceae bacterium]